MLNRIDTISRETTMLNRNISLLKRGITLKGKNLLQKRSKFFPFRVDPFSDRGLASKKANRKSQSGNKFFPLRQIPFSERTWFTRKRKKKKMKSQEFSFSPLQNGVNLLALSSPLKFRLPLMPIFDIIHNNNG